MGVITISVPTSGDPVTAASVANPLNTIKNEINGNLDNNNVKAGANISWSKIAKSGSVLNDIADVNISGAAEGDILYRNDSSKWVNLAAGTDGQYLKLASGVPSWATLSTTVSVLTTNTKARASKSGSQSVSHNTATKVQLNVETYDPGDNFDSDTNYRFVAPVTGYYQVNGAVSMSMDNGQELRAMIYKNDSEVARGQQRTGGSGDISANVSDLIYLEEDQYVELWTLHTYGGNRTINAFAAQTFMSVHLFSVDAS